MIVATALALAVLTTAAPVSAPTPSPATPPPVIVTAEESAATGEAERLVAAMSPRQRAAAVVMGHLPTTDPAQLTAYMTATGIGGFILMEANIPSTEAELRAVTAALTADPALPPLIAIDQEGGDVSRLGWDAFPSAVTLKDAPPPQTHSAFAGRGALVQRAGASVNFGVVADLTADPSMFIYRRALATAPAPGGEHVAAAVAGEAPFAASTLKHFPGHGAAPGDSHVGIPSTDMALDQWRATHAMPFAAGIDAGAPLLMFGHLAYTAVDPAPASLSSRWHDIARDDLGFEGVAITDDLGMLEASGIPDYADPVANAVAALAAGNDMVLTVMFSTADTAGGMVDGIAAAVEAGTLPEERLREAAVRVTALRLEVAATGAALLPCAECAPAE